MDVERLFVVIFNVDVVDGRADERRRYSRVGRPVRPQLAPILTVCMFEETKKMRMND